MFAKTGKTKLFFVAVSLVAHSPIVISIVKESIVLIKSVNIYGSLCASCCPGAY
jgi:hypothetical protein